MMKVFFELILAGLRLSYFLATKYIPNHIISTSEWLRIEKRAHRLNPHTATGKDLDYLGSLFDCKRDFWVDLMCEEIDDSYRIRILKEMGVEQ